MVYILLLLFYLLYGSVQIAAQDIEQVAKAKPIKVGGGISTAMNYYNAAGIDNRRPPFYWTINANLNFTFFGLISAPFSLQFSPQGNQFNYPYRQLQPFNKMGISPKYKAITVHLGYRNMNFSTYTSGGASFNGIGVEVQPAKSKWYAQALLGRLAKAITDGDNNNAPGITLYDRWAYGTKVGYKITNAKIELIAFKAWDSRKSLILEDRLEDEPPAENMVIGTNASFTVLKKINIKLEYALSAYTVNTLLANGDSPDGVYTILKGIYRPNGSSQYNQAINTSVNYQHAKFNTGLTYKRIDPEYQTMGIPFLNNDAEDITANLGWRMLKNKLNITTNGGVQRNNLDNTLVSRTVRLIGGANISYAPSNILSLTAGFANFSTNTVRTRIQELDSLEYYQVTTSANVSTNYRFGKDSAAQSLMLNANYQTANDAQNNTSEVYNLNLNYGLSIPSLLITVSVGLNGNINSFQGIENIGWGPMASFSRPFFDRQVKFAINSSLLTYQNGAALANRTFTIGSTLNYTLLKKHSFGLTYNFLSRKDFIGIQSFKENRAGIKYNFRF